MTPQQQLKRQRDAAFAAYLTEAKAKRPRRVLWLALVAVTREWHRAKEKQA